MKLDPQRALVIRFFGTIDAPQLGSFDRGGGDHSRFRFWVAGAVAFLIGLTFSQAIAAELIWKTLAPIPPNLGVAGAFAGLSSGSLLVAGGANFPDQMPWEGGAKVWYDDVYVLEKLDEKWRSAGKLPFPLGYGVALSHGRGLVCAGGSGPDRHYASAFILRWSAGRLTTVALPDLPEPRANMCGALLDNTVFLFGGTATPNSTHALNTLLSLDLSTTEPRWQTLEPLPGAGRLLAAAAAHEGAFFVFGGAAFNPGPEEKPVRRWLREAYRYTPGIGWKRLADLPRPAVAAPSPAPVVDGRLLLLGGDEGAQVATPPAEHRGFRRDILGYNPKTDQWEEAGTLPFAHVTTTAVCWQDWIVIPSGETKPGVRSPQVWSTRSR